MFSFLLKFTHNRMNCKCNSQQLSANQNTMKCICTFTMSKRPLLPYENDNSSNGIVWIARKVKCLTQGHNGVSWDSNSQFPGYMLARFINCYTATAQIKTCCLALIVRLLYTHANNVTRWTLKNMRDIVLHIQHHHWETVWTLGCSRRKGSPVRDRKRERRIS